MSDYQITQKSFELLAELEENNSKEWFDAHREEMKEYVQAPFEQMLAAATEALAGTAMPFKGSEKTMFRMNRDVRFSKDKSPYNPQVSGLLTPSGTKNEAGGLVYVQMDKEGGMMACGHYKLSASELAPLRDKIIEQPEKFAAVLESLGAAGLELSREDSLKSMPRGYSDYDEHEYADYLKLKTLVVMQPITKKAWYDEEVHSEIKRIAEACAPLLKFRPDEA